MWKRSDSQEVGLEAAIFQRKRNSSLVKRVCAENITGLKPGTEASNAPFLREWCVVEEYSCRGEGGPKGPLEQQEELMLQ